MEKENFWKELESGLLEAAETVEKAGKKVYATSRRALREADLKRALRDKLAALGRLYYNMEETEVEPELDELDALMSSIRSLDQALERLEQEKNGQKTFKTCPICNHKNEKDASFCSGCGVAL